DDVAKRLAGSVQLELLLEDAEEFGRLDADASALVEINRPFADLRTHPTHQVLAEEEEQEDEYAECVEAPEEFTAQDGPQSRASDRRGAAERAAERAPVGAVA